MSPVDLLGWACAALLAPMLCVSLFNLATALRLDRAPPPASRPRVSLLVPARNEAANLRANLPALLALRYPALEILVLDDASDDDGPAIVEESAVRSAGRLRLLRGAPVPPGWVGKCWACHQLAEAASGDVLLFCDADVTPAPEAVARTVGLLEGRGAGAVTALPRQRLGGWLEHAVVPLVVHLPVLALLPLRLVDATRTPSLSMANGQWLAFSREAYHAVGGHRAVRGRVVEDVALGRLVKGRGYRLVAAVATRSLVVRMYSDAPSLREGFRKNLYPLLGGRPAPLALALVLFLLSALVPWVLPLVGGSPLPLVLSLAVRACGAVLFRHGWRSVVLQPVGSTALVALAAASFLGTRRGTLRWKERTLPAQA